MSSLVPTSMPRAGSSRNSISGSTSSPLVTAADLKFSAHIPAQRAAACFAMLALPMNSNVTAEVDRPQTDSLLEGAYLKVSRRIVTPLLLAYIVAYLDRVNVGFAKLQMLAQL